MEEALWHLEDQWKLSTHKAILLFSSTCLLVILIIPPLCFFISRRRRGSSMSLKGNEDKINIHPPKWPPPLDREAPTALLVKRDDAWGSHSSSSAVWQKPILMGEKCELPRFSGLILYDQRGLPLDPRFEEGLMHVQVEVEMGRMQEVSPLVRTTTTTTTTLKDLL